MKRAAILLGVLGALVVCSPAQDAPPPQPASALCLEHVVWYPGQMRLEYTVSDGGTKPSGHCVRENVNMLVFIVDFKTATVKHNGEARGFEIGEAVDVRRMLHNLVTQYAQATTEWWFAKPAPPAKPAAQRSGE